MRKISQLVGLVVRLGFVAGLVAGFVAVTAIAACGAPLLRGGSGGPEVARLVACWTDALGGSARLAAMRSMEREAHTQAEGLRGTLHTWSRADGAWREEGTEGPSSGLAVFDGARGWSRDGLGAPLELSHTELADLRTQAYLESFAPLVAGRMAGQVRTGPRPHTLMVAAQGGSEALVVLDPRTCLPLRREHQIGNVHVTVAWPQWTTVDGIRVPAEVRVTNNRGDDEQIVYTSTRIDAAVEPALFSAPAVDPRARVPHLAEPLSLPAELTQNHVYVQARINGKGPVALLVDTGATNLLLDRARAQELGLGGEGKVVVRGAGEGQLESRVVALPTVDLGDAHFSIEAARTTPLTALSHREGRALEGVLGYELLGHYVVEFDYAAPAVRLHDPAGFQPPADAIALPFYFYDTKPIIEAMVELADGRRFAVQALVDTGDRGAFSLTTGFVQGHHLLDGPGPFLRAPLGFGVGGQTKQALGRVAGVHLGPVVVRDVLTSFSEDKAGATTDEAIQAHIGSDLMKQFTVWFDYPRRRMWLRKNSQFGEPFEYDASGILLESPDDTFHRAVVRNVLPGSPGAEAGVAVGDELFAVDGADVATQSLEAIRGKLRVPGTRVRLELRRGGTPLRVELALRRLI